VSEKTFSDDCPGCRPALLDPKTGKLLPKDDPFVVLVNKIYDELPKADKIAWHRFTCLNARDLVTVSAVKRFSDRIEAAGKAMKGPAS
jgi:hypothetical protein